MGFLDLGAAALRSWARRSAMLAPLTVLALLSVVTVVARLHTVDEPVERDIAAYAVIGHELLSGRQLYTDLWDHKPPAIHAAYALAEVVAGYGKWQIYLLGVALSLTTMLGVYAAARMLAGEAAGLWAAAFFVAVSCDLQLQANQPNTEVFLNACLVWGLVVWLRMHEGRAAVGNAVVAGCLLGIASLFKPVVAPWAGAMAAAHVFAAPAARRWAAVIECAVVAAVAAAWWLAVVGWFAVGDRLVDFSAAVFLYNSAYAGSPVFNLIDGLKPSRLLPNFMHNLLPLVAVAAMSLALLRSGPLRRGGALTAAYAAAVPLMIALPGRFHPHYYQLWLPVLAVGCACVIALLADRKANGTSWRLHGAAGALLALLAALQIPGFALTAEEWSVRKYGPIFAETKTAGELLNSVLRPEDTVFQWGEEPGVYLYSRRSPPVGVIYDYPMREGPVAGVLSARTLKSLIERPPTVIVLRSGAQLDPRHPVVAWFMARYREIRLGDEDSGFRYLARPRG